MFFRKKKEETLTKEALEYKRGYNDGYQAGLEKTESNVRNFNNNMDYVKGYEYGYRVGIQQARMNQMKISNNSQNDVPLPNQNLNTQNSSEQNLYNNQNMFNKFNNRF